jgi:hypothetical protein
MSKKRDKRVQVLSAVVVCVFLLILAGQAFLRISAGDFAGGKENAGHARGFSPGGSLARAKSRIGWK